MRGVPKRPAPKEVVRPTTDGERRANLVALMRHAEKPTVRHLQLYKAMRGVEFLLRSASPCVLTERATLRLFVQFRSERKAVYALLDYYGLAYESRDTAAVEGQNGPRHCSECAPYWMVPAKVIVVTGPSGGEHISLARVVVLICR
jgi:hypothetical protein